MNIQEIKTFLTGGKAVGTLTSDRSLKHFTYRVSAVKDADNKFFVSLLTGPDNTSDYSYLGLLTVNYDGSLAFRTTAKSCAGEDADSVRGLRWLLNRVNSERELVGALFEHEGRCAVCARPLTNPESLERGIGPYCAGLL